MQNRLQKFLQAENITPARFADQIGIQRSGVSHILSGRNKPGFDFIEKMLRCYPSLNAEWIITGKGKMYKEIRTASLFDEASATPPATTLVAPSAQTAAPIVSADQDSEESATEQLTEKHDLNTTDITKYNAESKQSVKIAKVVLFYSDNTFIEYSPRN
jgi:transcriptional regulator with XRE-family HTH domain